MDGQQINILAFGKVAEKLGQEQLQASGFDDTESLLHWLHDRYPALKQVDFSLAVDRKLVTGKTGLGRMCEVALLPPFSGG
ncbi:MAG: MoaD/ThiS family protein [Saprospiraceae bacterium]|jgi:molybdopterin synthase sulfur carrier subunit|nr:MoaD/ThiS family protein [Saprospiraceae bacterium]MBP9209309.1 MoaD/ThiS family protein [Saprospiraceae bacterium]MBV6474283.1 hypothetical protein [Saprospiraceae bacterium]